MKFISVDPSMSNTALVFGEIVDGNIVPVDYLLLQTTSAAKKGAKMSDLVRRAELILGSIISFKDVYKPFICFAELPSGSQSQSASVGIGISVSIIGLLNPRTEVTPVEVKRIVGLGAISKKEVMAYCLEKYPTFPFEKKKDGSLVEGRMEHVCDALVIAEAGLKKFKKESLDNSI